MGRDERAVEKAAPARGEVFVVPFEDPFHQTFERRQIAPRLDLMVGRGDRGRAEGCHLDRILRRGKLFECTLLQRVEDDDRDAAPGGLMQCGHHPGMVCARVMAEAEDGVGVIEILERHGALADADGFWKAHRSGLVAHVAAVGEIVRAVGADEKLE
jgi:hypothetical protein